MRPSLSTISTDTAPKAIGPYSQAVACGDLVFVSGQIPLDPATGEMVAGSFALQVQRVLDNLDAILMASGCSRSTVLKVNVSVTDLGKFSELNEVYARFFADHRPARAVVGVSALPRGAQVEIEAVAVRL